MRHTTNHLTPRPPTHLLLVCRNFNSGRGWPADRPIGHEKATDGKRFDLDGRRGSFLSPKLIAMSRKLCDSRNSVNGLFEAEVVIMAGSFGSRCVTVLTRVILPLPGSGPGIRDEDVT